VREPSTVTLKGCPFVGEVGARVTLVIVNFSPVPQFDQLKAKVGHTKRTNTANIRICSAFCNLVMKM